MQRKTVYTLVVIVGFVIAGILGYVYYPRNYPVFADVSKPDEFPEVSWQDIVQGRVARSLRRQSPPLPEGVVPIAEYIASSDGYFEELGIRIVELSTELVMGGVYGDVMARPVRLVAGYRTRIGEEGYYVLYAQWRNGDGAVSYLPYILPDNRVIWQGQVDDKYLQLVDPANNYYLAPIVDFSRVEICSASMGKLTGYCEWMDGKAGVYERLGRAWVEEAGVPRAMERYPVMFSRKQWVRGGGMSDNCCVWMNNGIG